MSTRKRVNLNSRCELMRNPRKKAVANRNAASITGAFPSGLPKPALRALYAQGFRTLPVLCAHTVADVAMLHGIGPKAMAVLRNAMRERSLAFRDS